MHIVGLGFDPDDPAFNALLAEQQRLRRIRIGRLVELVPAAWRRGLDVTKLAAAPCVAPSRTHLARALARRVPGGMGTVSPWLADEHLAAAGVNPFPAPDVICAAIAAAGGIAILAHPACYRDLPGVIRIIDACGPQLAGIEAAHPGLTPELQAELFRLADARGLLTSAGSDLHRPGARTSGMVQLPPERTAALLARLNTCRAAA